MMALLVTVCIVVVLLILVYVAARSPLSDWSSYWYVFGKVASRSRDVFWLRGARFHMLVHLIGDLIASPFHSLLWRLDEILFSRKLNEQKFRDPVFIISQPRCGSTFLHRTLAKDSEQFFAITYLEWRWPYICVWWLIDRLRLRPWLDRLSYWSRKSEAGSIASKMHPHHYGDYEEYGIFLEEKFYNHYFIFRRFPLVSILNNVVNFKMLDHDHMRQICQTLIRVAKKAAYYRGDCRIWLTKENESVEFYRLLLSAFPKSAAIFLVRNHADMLASYIALSRASTLAKTGIDITQVWDLYDANLRFRRQQCRAFSSLYDEIVRLDKRRAVLVNYDSLVDDVLISVEKIYYYLGLSFPHKFHLQLANERRQQKHRRRGYSTGLLPEADLRGFDEFARLVEVSKEEGVL